MSARLTVTLKGMRFHARVGTLPHEHEVAQPIEVDISAECKPLPGMAGDPLLDYRLLYQIASEALISHHTELLEQVARRILDDVLALPQVAAARVSVRKPHVAIPGLLDYAEVSLEQDA